MKKVQKAAWNFARGIMMILSVTYLAIALLPFLAFGFFDLLMKRRRS